MDFKTLQQAAAHLSWNLDFYAFCRKILQKEEEYEVLVQDAYCNEKWKDWQKFNSALHAFDDDTRERMIEVYQSQQ